LIFGETGKLPARRGGGHFCDEPYVHRYGEEQKCADNEVWQANRQFVK